VFIGYDDNDAMFIRDEEDAYATLRSCLGRTYAMYKTVVMMDGILSDDAECQESTVWCSIDDFSFDATNTRILRFWDLGYSNIEELNLLLRDVPGLAIDGKEQMLAEVRTLRAFTYLQLVSYFGDVPIPDDVWLNEAQTRHPTSEVYALLIEDLESALAVIPAGPSTDRSTLSSDAVRVLLAKAALLEGDFPRVEALTAEVIESARYQLVGSTEEAFADNTNAEIIWDLSFGYNEEFTQYFFGRSFGPALRLAQVYLMRAEAQIELNNLDGGGASLDLIRGRLGLSPSSGVTVDELRVELRDTWKLEMSREGDRFINLVRWNLADETLYANGYNPSKHSVLPLPQVVMDKYYNMFQNPGY
jgi:starch-binding outer membrane protein, SusD/RagB family